MQTNLHFKIIMWFNQGVEFLRKVLACGIETEMKRRNTKEAGAASTSGQKKINICMTSLTCITKTKKSQQIPFPYLFYVFSILWFAKCDTAPSEQVSQPSDIYF